MSLRAKEKEKTDAIVYKRADRAYVVSIPTLEIDVCNTKDTQRTEDGEGDEGSSGDGKI